jgi:DNA-binding CsgD family transcriptional regulator
MTPPPPPRYLPALLRDMAETFGLPVALRFAELWGGRYLHLPAVARPEHPVAQALGVAVLEWLIAGHDAFARIVVPRGPSSDAAVRAARAAELIAAGASANEIAAQTGLHVRSVHRAKARLRDAAAAARQGQLFE